GPSSPRDRSVRLARVADRQRGRTRHQRRQGRGQPPHIGRSAAIVALDNERAQSQVIPPPTSLEPVLPVQSTTPLAASRRWRERPQCPEVVYTLPLLTRYRIVVRPCSYTRSMTSLAPAALATISRCVGLEVTTASRRRMAPSTTVTSTTSS